VYEEQVEVRNVPGIHARPAAVLVQEASRYKAEIFITANQLTVNGKSIMGVMMLAAETGIVLTIKGEGPDAVKAVKALVTLIEAKFDED
jgi:phosphocarrier protein HPr